LDQRVELLAPGERSAYRGLFNLATLCVEYLARGNSELLAPIAAAIETAYEQGDQDVLKALNTAYLEDLWRNGRHDRVSVEPLVALFGPLTRRWWDTTSDWLESI